MKPIKVLVVEDQDLIRDIMVEVLTEAGFAVDTAETGDDASKLIDQDGYCLLLTDVQMPGELDGVDLAAYARKKKPGLPIVFMTGRPDVMRQVTGSRICSAVIPKPYSPEHIVNTIRKMLAIEGD